jgi:hypothetical protein
MNEEAVLCKHVDNASHVCVGHVRLGATLCDAMALSHGTAHSSTAMILGPATFGTFFLQGRSGTLRVACLKWRRRRDLGLRDSHLNIRTYIAGRGKISLEEYVTLCV